MKLYGYWRSSAAYRVRIALNLKNIDCELESVHLVKNGGEQHSDTYQALNPNRLVPTLVDGELSLNQSMAILEYLERQYPEVPLLPASLQDEMHCRALALDVAIEIHPLNNLRVLQYLSNDLGVEDDAKTAWYHHWLTQGFDAFETRIKDTCGLYSMGDKVTWADICLVPQVYNAKRFNFDLSPYPLIQKIVDNLNKLPAFIDALPENQPDAA
jgi:maleylacetoacetate isomerase